MAYFFKDIRLLEKKPVSIAFNAIYGIGNARGYMLCDFSGISRDTLLSTVPNYRFNFLVYSLKRIGMTEVNLQRFRHARFKLFNNLMTYKSFKFRNGLPIWGQSSRTNARTSRRMRKN